MKEDTKIVHKGRDPKSNHGIINPPVYHASTIAWGSVEEIAEQRKIDRRFEPTISDGERDALRARWSRAVERSKGWEPAEG